MEPYLSTYKGYRFYLDRIEENLLSVSDIAHALSLICRFTGHVEYHYSVAQHSYLASFIVPQKFQLEALLHDAQEAYLSDMASPLKSKMPGYRALEDRVELYIRNQFGLPGKMSPEVKEADLMMLKAEQKTVLRNEEMWSCLEGIPDPLIEIIEMPPREVEKLWLHRLWYLLQKHNVSPAVVLDGPPWM